MNFDRAKFRTELHRAIKAGHGQRILASLDRDGVYRSAYGMDSQQLVPFDMAVDMAFDAPASASPAGLPPQSPLVTVGSSGIPLFMTTWVDPKAIEILVSPMLAAVIAGETGKGSWEDDIYMFKTVEATGQTSTYGDYSREGSADVNYNFPQRQNYRFQAFLQYGDLEIAKAAKAKIDLPADKQSANALALMKALNFMYFFGVGSLANYGLLNDPNLLPPISPTFSWLSSASATANTIYQDVVRLVVLVLQQTNGAVNANSKMTLAMSPANAGILSQVTMFNTNSVLSLLKQNYPNMRLETAPEYETAAGQLVQLIVDDVEGQKTVECVFSSKMMAHRVVQDVSSVLQKRSSSGYGTVFYRTVTVAQMLG
jgi:Uncharacterized protein conserved in bacteria (DUF2184)